MSKRHPDLKPTHPGAVLRDMVLPEMHISVAKFAEMLGVSRQSLNEILQERRAISPEMAVRIGIVLGNGPDIWSDMQTALNNWIAEKSINTDKLRKDAQRLFMRA